jgi:hypothetical protein
MGTRDDQRETRMESQGGVSRRGLLKVLAAAGGTAAAAAALPDRWLKPMVQIGATPAHAQTSAPRPILSSLDFDFALMPSPPGGRGVISPLQIGTRFSYIDPLGEVDDTATLSATLDPCGEILYEDKPLGDLPGYKLFGDAERGKVQFTFPHLCTNGPIGELCLNLTVKGRTSDTICGIYNTLELPSLG